MKKAKGIIKHLVTTERKGYKRCQFFLKINSRNIYPTPLLINIFGVLVQFTNQEGDRDAKGFNDQFNLDYLFNHIYAFNIVVRKNNKMQF